MKSWLVEIKSLVTVTLGGAKADKKYFKKYSPPTTSKMIAEKIMTIIFDVLLITEMSLYCTQRLTALRSKGNLCSIVSFTSCSSIKIICSKYILPPLFLKLMLWAVFILPFEHTLFFQVLSIQFV